MTVFSIQIEHKFCRKLKIFRNTGAYTRDVEAEAGSG